MTMLAQRLGKLLLDNWGLFALLILWELWIWIGQLDPIVMPHSWSVVAAVLREPMAYSSTLMTLAVATAGLALGALFGVALAILAWFSRFVQNVATLGALVLASVPVVAFIPLLGRILGYDVRSVIAIITIICFFPFFVFTSAAFSAVPTARLDLARVFGARRPLMLRLVVLPSALPGISAALKVAAPTSILAAMTAEYFMGTPGLGSVVHEAMFRFQTEHALAASLIAAIVSIAVFGAASRFERFSIQRWT